MSTSKKGAELALNILIIAAIGLIVLVIVLFIFGGKSSDFSKNLADCAVKRGVCKDVSDCSGPTVSGTSCESNEPPQVCCISL